MAFSLSGALPGSNSVGTAVSGMGLSEEWIHLLEFVQFEDTEVESKRRGYLEGGSRRRVRQRLLSKTPLAESLSRNVEFRSDSLITIAFSFPSVFILSIDNLF